MKYTGLLLSSCILVYLFAAFLCADFNAGNWSMAARGWSVVAAIVVWLLACAGDKP